MFGIHRKPIWRVLLAVGFLSVGLAVAPAQGAEPVEPIVGTWIFSGGEVQISGANGSFVGVVTKATRFGECIHPVGQQMWSMTGSGLNYSGTHIGFWLPECTDNPMAATFVLKISGADYLLSFCTDYCSFLKKSIPNDGIAPMISIVPSGGIVGIGKNISVTFKVKDDSGKARVYVDLYSGGAKISTLDSGYIVATGGSWIIKFKPSAGYGQGGRNGPFYICVRAVDEKGNVSKPDSKSCQWRSIEVKLSQASNKCAPQGYGAAVEKYVNWMADTQKYKNLTVSFTLACDIHDAGYTGATVYDPINRKVTDFRTWSRQDIDALFFDNIVKLCRKVSTAKWFREACEEGLPFKLFYGKFLPGSYAGALTYWGGVRYWGRGAYDADATVPETQDVVPTMTTPDGGARNND